MDVEKFSKNLEKELSAERLRQNVKNTLQDMSDKRQDMRFEREEIFQPIVSRVKEGKETIDDRQDKVIAKLTENENALTTGIQALQMQPTTSALPTPDLPPSPKAKLIEMPDSDKKFSGDEIKILMECNLAPPSTIN